MLIGIFGGNNMEEIIVRGGNQLNGTVRIEGAKMLFCLF